MFGKCLVSLCTGLSLLSLVHGGTVETFGTTPTESEVTIVMAGDNLIHKPVITAGIQEDGTRDYTYMYSEITEYIKNFDVRIINQETPFIEDESKYSGYPQFGSPVEIGDAVADAGFNVVCMATNHVCDQGAAGISDSYETWMRLNIPVVGIHPKWDNCDIWYLEENGIRIAVCNYTYGTNGLSLPSDSEYTYCSLNDKERIAETLAEAETTADVTLVVAHWGTEYIYTPTKWQRDMAQFLADNGADIIIGGHPHVIEPLEYIETESGSVPVFWSIGNFISGQSEVPRMLGILAEVTIRKDTDGKVSVVSTNATPVVTHISKYSEQFKVYLLDEYTEELCAEHRLRRTRGSEMSLSNLWKLWDTVMEE